MLVDFEYETENAIVAAQNALCDNTAMIDEVCLYYRGEVYLATSHLNFNELKEYFKLNSLLYNNDYGEVFWEGFITFRGADKVWLQRREYDGAEWWEVICKPRASEYVFAELKKQKEIKCGKK